MSNDTAIRDGAARAPQRCGPMPRHTPGYLERCGRALDEALRCAPAYEPWRAMDPGPAAPVLERFAALPTLTKRELRVYGPQGFVPRRREIARGLASAEIEIVETSGSTGDRVANVWYQPWWDASEEASWRLNAHARFAGAGDHREAILTSPWCAGFPCEDGYLTTERRTSGRFLYLTERSDPSTWSVELMDRMAAELNAFAPRVLEANPSFLARLSRHIVERRLAVRSPSLIVLTYENPSILHRRQIARAFDSPAASSYGATEAGYVFMECEAGRMHQVTDACHVDFLPFAGEHGGPKLGRILVTTFDNPWRSLLRFDVGDVVRLDGETPCACGRNEGLVLMSVEGRTVNVTSAPDGRAVTQGAVDRALGEVAGLVEYQIIQTGPAAYHLRVAAARADERRVAGEARDAALGLYGPDAVVTAERVESIAPAPPGKYRLAAMAESMALLDPDELCDPACRPRRLKEGPV